VYIIIIITNWYSRLLALSNNNNNIHIAPLCREDTEVLS